MRGRGWFCAWISLGLCAEGAAPAGCWMGSGRPSLPTGEGRSVCGILVLALGGLLQVETPGPGPTWSPREFLPCPPHLPGGWEPHWAWLPTWVTGPRPGWWSGPAAVLFAAPRLSWCPRDPVWPGGHFRSLVLDVVRGIRSWAGGVAPGSPACKAPGPPPPMSAGACVHLSFPSRTCFHTSAL